MRPYSPGGMLIVFTAAQKGSIPPTPSIHRLPRGLPGYLILFAPHAFAPQRQFQSRKPPSPLVFLPISTHFTATPVIPLSSPALQPTSIQSNSHLESRTFTPDLAAAVIRRGRALSGMIGRKGRVGGLLSLDRLSVPMWPITLSGRLPIVALVGCYLTN